ncbi:MAG: transposase [Acidobacteriia bacterium]|nr:transposase [Terriglobia bacterium]
MIRACKVKLGRAPKQEAKLRRVLGLCCALYNAALQQRREAWQRQRVSLSFYEQCKELTQLRSDDDDYRNLPAQMTRVTVLHRLDKAFHGFFRRVKRGEKPGFPRFRSWERFDTLTFTTQDWHIDGKKLVLNVRKDPIVFQMRNTIYREGEIKGLRIVRGATRWWAHFLVDIGPAPTLKKSSTGVGIDVGLRTFATMSDGTQIEHPRFLRKSIDKLRESGQSVSHKRKGSRNRGKAKLVLARAHEKIANRRRNFIHQTVATLVKRYDGFAVEKLNVQEMSSTEHEPDEMTKKGARGLRRGIMDSGWTMFGTHLAAKAEEAGLPFVRVNPRGTSQRCSGCGSVVRKTLRDRTHYCAACGLVMDRDENAARNIYDLGRRSATGDARVEGAEVSSE